MGKKKYMVGIDIGSGGCKVTIIDKEGNVCGSGYREYPTYYPHPGWSEQDPQEWYQALKLTLKDALGNGGISAQQIASIAIGAATHTMVLLDEKNEVLRPAILWTDKRTISQVEALRSNYGREIFEETLHTANVNWTLPYLVWVREKEPEVWKRTKRLLMPKDYIRFKLTGVSATDWMDAHGTLMFNVLKREWSEKICNLVGIPMEILPPVHPPEKIAERLSRTAGEELGLPEGILVVIGTTDQASEAFGSGAIEPGQGIIKIATAGNVAVVTKDPHPSPLKVYAYFHIKPAYWYTLAGTISCAVCYRWLRDALCEEEIESSGKLGLNPYELMDHLAEKAPVGCEGLIFHPYLQGAIWNPYLKADFIGITPRHRKEHFVRAVLEGVAFSLYNCVKELETLGVEIKDFRIIGGGARSPLWRQIVCDTVGMKLLRPKIDDSSFGTALVGGIGVGLFKTVEEAVNQCVQYVDVLQPNLKNHETYAKLFEVYRRVSEDLDGASKLLHHVLQEIPQTY
jgi:xylulokinase